MKDRPAVQRTPSGLEIPVPKRSEVVDAFKKALRPKPKKS